MNDQLLAQVQTALPETTSAMLTEQLTSAQTDPERLAVLRLCAQQVRGIIGTSRFKCVNWWADAICPGYSTIVYADTELAAATLALTQLLEHHASVATQATNNPE